MTRKIGSHQRQAVSIRLKQLGNLLSDLCNKILNFELKKRKNLFAHTIIIRFHRSKRSIFSSKEKSIAAPYRATNFSHALSRVVLDTTREIHRHLLISLENSPHHNRLPTLIIHQARERRDDRAITCLFNGTTTAVAIDPQGGF